MALPMEHSGRPPVPPRAANKRVTKRMLERKRQRRRKLTVAGLAITVLVLGGAGVVMIAPLLGGGDGNVPPPGPAPPGQPMHIHANLSIWRGTQKATLPSDIGRTPGNHYNDHGLDQFLDTREGDVGKLSPLHTHDASGVIHIEASVTRAFTLGEFFSVWGQPLGPQATVDLVADTTHTLTMTVNGQPSSEWGTHVFVNYDDIEVHYDAA
jgi:hypothetical protein